MQAEQERIYQLHADYCRSLANPTRLMVLDCLRDGEKSVSDIAARVSAPLSTVSMRSRGEIARELDLKQHGQAALEQRLEKIPDF